MGFFNKKLKYPELDSTDPANGQLHNMEGPLQDLMGQISDQLEVIPSDDHAYVFIGKPPKKFGVAMIEQGQVQNFIAAAKEKGLDQAAIHDLNEKLREAYMHNMDAQRFKTSVGGKEVVVTPCEQLDQEVQQIMNNLGH